MDGEQHARVGEQGKGQPLQVGDVDVIGHENLQQQCRGHENDCHGLAGKPGHQFGNLAHGSDVGGNVADVGDKKQDHDAVQHGRRKGVPDVGRQPLARNAPDRCAHQLDRRHQRKRERHGPEHSQAVLRARLRIRRYAAGVVIGDSGDEPRTDLCQRMFPEAIAAGFEDSCRPSVASFRAARRLPLLAV